MRLGGRIDAAISVIDEVETRKRPISEALRDWGNAHRFAGSGDRSAIGNLVYDVFRSRRSLAFFADEESAASLAFAAVLTHWGYAPERLVEALAGDKFAPDLPPLARLEEIKARDLTQAEPAVQADLPDWLVAPFEASFAEDWVREGEALAKRPSLDLRVNLMKASREKALKELQRFKPKATCIARHGIRIAPGRGEKRLPNIQAEAAYQKGWIEVQDEGSQIAADLVFAQAGEKVLDYCAGAGGKTLAMAAAMENRGQVHAYDVDRQRLAPIYERLKRAGCRNVQVHAPNGEGTGEGMAALVGRMDRVVVDAPCTGSGTWRRHPEAKWRLTEEAVAARCEEQAAVLEEAALYVRPGGYLVYITCSVLSAENEEQLLRFAEHNPDFEIVSVGEAWQDLFGFDKPQPWSLDFNAITLTPASTGTDGFFIGVLQRCD